MGYDIIGDIAIVETEKREAKTLAKEILETHKNVKVVLRKGSGRKGVYRLKKYGHVAGEKRTTTVHKESGCSFVLDVAKVYFSVRESTERQRIAALVKNGERVLVMFAGAGPYAIVIAKRKTAEVVAVEINPDGVAYMLENIRVNKVMNRVFPVAGDVKEVVPTLGTFDRILMPLPQSAHEFLDVAISALKKGGTLHFYDVGPEEKPFEEAEKHLKDAAKRNKRKLKIAEKRTVLPYAPRVYKVCIDSVL